MPRIGKSIEEILLSRSSEKNLTSATVKPSSQGFPERQHLVNGRQSRGQRLDGQSVVSNSASSLRSHGGSLGIGLTGNISSAIKPMKRNENETITIESLMEHSRALQLHVKVN
jgi:hypothetical protein